MTPYLVVTMKNKKQNKIDFSTISETEKELLKKRVLSSVTKTRNRRHRIRYTIGIAASIAIVACATFFFREQEKPRTITDFVETAKKVDVNETDEVVLILNDTKNVKVNGESATITYSATGEKVTVGGDTALDQDTSKDDKVVYNTILVPYGKRTELVLSDGTKVWLNSGSRFVYPAAFKSGEREVYLEGEAIFEVTHNAEKPFKVHSESQEITVLGTVFNVSNYLDDNSSKTVLKSGSVAIKYLDDSLPESENHLRIVPGTLANYDKNAGKVASEKVNVDHYFSWREGVLIFKNDDLQTIMRRLARYYNIRIDITDEALAKGTFSGYLDLKEDVEKVIGIIKETTDFEYEKVSNSEITITN